MTTTEFIVNFKLMWDLRAVFQFSLHLFFFFPGVPDGLLENRTLNLHCRIDPTTGRVSVAVHDPQRQNEGFETPAITQLHSVGAEP